MHSEIGIDIDAPPAIVFALARDVERWATMLPHYLRSEAVAHDATGRPIVRFIARRSLIGIIGLALPVVWTSRTWSEPGDLRLRFQHVAGATRGMDVTWRIEPRGSADASRVTIAHDFRPPMPGFARFVDRWFTRPIAGRTLATFKALAEAVTAAAAADQQSGWPSETNRSR
jgi:ribosome-associated toxin RatA of RatAB toxin-antitoxin module